MNDLPFDLEMFLIVHGFHERERAPGAVRHAPVARPKHKNRHKVSVGWKPSFDGEDPPF